MLLCITNELPGRSCTIRGYHLTDVDGTVHYSRPGVECTGCLPRPAEVGMLCRFCWERFEAALSTVTDLIPHLRSIEKGPTDVAGVRTAPGSRVILPASWIEADNLWVSLAAVAIVHAAEKRIPEPNWLPWTDQPSSPPRGFPTLYGLAPDATLNEVTLAVHEAARWVAAAPEDVVSRAGGAETAVAMFRAVQRALAMFPMQEQARAVKYLRCRACGQDGSLEDLPPLERLDDPVLRCSNRECGAEFDPTLSGVDMIKLAREVAADRGIGRADLERDIAELLRIPAPDEADPLCWTHARGLPPHLVVRKVKPVEQECVRCGIKTESGLYRRVTQEVAA